MVAILTGGITITADSIIKAAAVIVALGTIGGVIIAIVKWYLKQQQVCKDLADFREKSANETSSMKKEQTVICYALLACLDGLHQLGANGNVSEALNALEKHLNKSAHEQE